MSGSQGFCLVTLCLSLSFAVCPNPVKIPNGEVVGTKFDVGSSIQYKCHDVHRIAGSSYSFCRCIGSSCRWVPPPASCVPLECPAPGNVTNGMVRGTVFRYDHWIAFHCLPGYQLNGSSHSVCRCSNNSCNWSSPLPTCIELACSDPGAPEHGSREGLVNFTGGARVRYKCDPGYYLLGSSESTCYCLPHKCHWLPARPICTKGCVKPPPIPNCETTGNDCGPGGSLYFRCSDGYSLKGSQSVTCTCNGDECHWDSIFPRCVELRSGCGRPRKPKNGYRRGRNYGVGGRVSFDCRYGYDLRGSHDIVCQCRGGSCQWHPPIDQRCIPVRTTCPWPTLANGIVKYGLDRSVRYTCDNGYRMKGEAIGVCKCPSTEHCHWTPQPPRCVHHTTTTCAAPKLDHGHITGSKTALYEEHRHIRFSCDSGYRLSNSSDVVCKCKKDGCYWSPSLPTCTKGMQSYHD
jgi:CUB/sushi domain-containing protein